MQHATSHFITANASNLTTLPEPSQEWRGHEVDYWIRNRLHDLKDRDIITMVRRERNRHRSKFIGVYQTNEDAYDHLQSKVRPNQDALLPCGHNAFTNKRDVPGISCKICKSTFDPVEVRG